MMRFTALLWLLMTAGTLLAAPGPAAPPPVKDRKALREEARKFAQQLNHLCEQIATQYVRPLSREELLQTALTGLYESARRPVPRDLRAQVRQAVSLASMMRAEAIKPVAMNDVNRPQLDPVEKLLVRLREELGDSLAAEGRPAILLAARSLARLLDPHSGVVSAEEQRRTVGVDHENLGTGLMFRDAVSPGPLEIEGVQPGSPAQRAGLRPGDRIVKIDDQPIANAPKNKLLALRNSRPVDETVPNLAGPQTTTPPVDLPRMLRITYRRGENPEQTVSLLRERYRAETVQGVRRRDDNTWDWMVDDKSGLAHIRIVNLGRGTADELRVVLGTLRDRKARGLILDLRWCPGGYLNEAVELADLFLGNGTIATIKNRAREDTVYRSSDDAHFRELDLVVLVNGETSGGAELIAAALQDHKRGLVVGQRTLGKASVQTPLAVGIEGFGFKLTSGTFVRPSGKNLHRFPDSPREADWGVIPDEDARLSPELGKRLKQWWQWQSLRPARTRERLPLDDPRSDPQQLMALTLLRKMEK